MPGSAGERRGTQHSGRNSVPYRCIVLQVIRGAGDLASYRRRIQPINIVVTLAAAEKRTLGLGVVCCLDFGLKHWDHGVGGRKRGVLEKNKKMRFGGLPGCLDAEQSREGECDKTP